MTGSVLNVDEREPALRLRDGQYTGEIRNHIRRTDWEDWQPLRL